jgi:cobyrinic acid a,c-diamide synthase
MLQHGTRDVGDWLGAMMYDEKISLPHRHLGLINATELDDALDRLDIAADGLVNTPLGQMKNEDLKRWNVSFDLPFKKEPIQQLLVRRKIAIARDAAFCFIYQANLDTLKSLGAELIFFSPLKDKTLPICDAVWLPGGYPELYPQVLSENKTMAQSMHEHVNLNRPVWAECGGMMVLFESIEQIDGSIHPMWGVLPGKTVMQKKLAKLGPQKLTLNKGELRGHTFHYSLATTTLSTTKHTNPPDSRGGKGEEIYQYGPVRASYFHPWFASNPDSAASLFMLDSLI